MKFFKNILENNAHPQFKPWQWWALCVVALTAILYWRRPDAFYNPQLWAEDGSFFLTQAQFSGGRSVFLPYAGYYHLLARLVAWAGLAVPNKYIPHWYSFAAWLALVGLVTYLFSPRFSLAPARKFLLGLALVATPIDNEIFFNIASWPFVLGPVWCLLAITDEATTWQQGVFDIGLLVVSGLNTPFALCFWPLFGLRWLARRTPPNLGLFIASLGIALVQFSNTPTRIQAEGAWPAVGPMVIDELAYRFGYLFMGEWVYALFATEPVRWTGLLIILGLYAYLLHSAWAAKNGLVLLLLTGGAAATTLSLYVVRHTPEIFLYSAGRHFFLPALTTTWALLLSQSRNSYLKWGALGLIGLAFVGFTPAAKNEVRPDLQWAAEVARCAEVRPMCRIPINPIWEPPNIWYANLYAHRYALPAGYTPLAATFTDTRYAPSYPATASRITDTVALVGYTTTQTATTFVLEAASQLPQTVASNYYYFVDVLSTTEPQITLAHQEDTLLYGLYPTSHWQAGEVVIGQVAITLTTLPPGNYEVAVGWRTASGGRLLVQVPAGQRPSNNRIVLPLTFVIPAITPTPQP